MIPDAASTSGGLGINLVVTHRWMRGGSSTAGVGILFLDFRKLFQHNTEIHLQHLEEVRVNLILDHAFGLRTSQADVPLAQQSGDVSFGYLGLGLKFVLKLAQLLGSKAELGLKRGQRKGGMSFFGLVASL